MRVLFTIQPGAGHFHPLVPVARALVAAGHDPCFACAASFCPTVEASGFRAVAVGMDWLESALAEAFPAWDAIPPGPERQPFAFRRIFAGAVAEAALPDLLGVAEAWRPDVVVRDRIEFAGMLAAERLGIPWATSGYGTMLTSAGWQGLLGPAVDDLRAGAGLPPDPELACLSRFLDIALVPRSYIAGEYTTPTRHYIRPTAYDHAGDERLPGWVASLPDQPTVYATLGTIFNQAPAHFEAIIEGLREAGVNLIVTVGHTVDPDQFGPQPPHVRIERYIPQTLLLPHCDAVVTHGGFGTVMAALEHGLPLVVTPMAADQPDNARRCAACGLGVALGREERTPDAIRAAVEKVLGETSFRRNTVRMRGEIEAMPGPEHAVALLERLAVEKQPLLTS